MCAATANAEIHDDPVPGSSKSWNVRSVGGGAPDSADKIDRFWVYNSSNGHIGKCGPIITGDTVCGVKVRCIDRVHTVDTQLWNVEGSKSWHIYGPGNSHVRYEAYAYGKHTYSTGTVSTKS